MTVFWENTALRQDSLQMFRRASHQVSFQPPPPVPHWWFSCSMSLPFGTLLEKISSSRPLLSKVKGKQYCNSWRFVSEMLYYYIGIINITNNITILMIIIIVIVAVSFWLFINVILIFNTAGNPNLILFCC